MARAREDRGIVVERCWSAERIVRSAAHQMGVRFRLLDRDMPGHPHLIVPSRRAVLFVCSCNRYFHHCEEGRANEVFNQWRRSALHHRKGLDAVCRVLNQRRWRAGVIWECETTEPEALRGALAREIGDDLQDRPLPAIPSPQTAVEVPQYPPLQWRKETPSQPSGGARKPKQPR